MAAENNSVIVRELRGRNEAELTSLLDGKTDELQKAKFKFALGQLQETHKLGSLKRDIARIYTVLSETRK